MTVLSSLTQVIIELYQKIGLTVAPESLLFQSTSLVLMLILAWLSFRITRLVLTGKFTNLLTRSSIQLDDELHKHGFFTRCGHLVPAVLIYLLSPLLLSQSVLLAFMQNAALIYVMVATVAASSAVLNTIEDLYNASELAKKAPVTGFIQVAKLFIVIIAAVLIISTLLNKSPFLLLSGLGAITAILLLLFRDTILGLVAGIQIAANRMVNTGDWITMEKYGADGDVLEVGLTTVKVQNWDKTISTIPTYSLITDSVKNWRGMAESQGRRIKRAVYIDVNSIQFFDQEMLDKLSKVRYISEYLEGKRKELEDYHHDNSIDVSDLLNSRRLTNIGTFRMYLESYLRHHKGVNTEMTLMVRQLSPTELGLPLELYCFSKNKEWVVYEALQADIFDHVLAMLPIFGLRAYQRISDRQPSA